ncbi:MAG TPA: DegT/DnrJ/EryC1/StrS family aminotransferase, partial [Acidobacteriota bacterium]|nr:DegT/DnrJ/EryC1/StrS family aminotransferase [Acidobacteriota bacterium]
LEFALRTCGVRRGDEVILPTFCCPSVVAPILAAGATPVLADVGRELNLTAASVKAALTQKTRAVIVPHLFGNPAAIEEIVESVRGKSICVVDDAAQALGATIAGRPVGGFGDAGILSFGAEKVCFGLGGGVLLSRNRDIDDPFTRSDWPASALGPALKNLCATFFLRRLRRWTRPIDSRWSAKSPDESPQQYRREAMSNLAAAVAGSLIDSLQENLTARRARVELYRELLRECRGLQLIPHRAGSACLSQVIRVSPRRCSEDAAAKLIDMLRTSGYEVQGSYVPIHLLANFGQCVWDRLPHAERVWADLVELPCEPGVSLADVERIAEILRGHVGD